MKPKETEAKTTRRQRIEQIKRELRGRDLDGMNLKLQASKRPGFTRRFVKANPERLAKFRAAGWDHVQPGKDEITPTISGTRLGVSLGRTNEGPGTKGLLMEIPTERYQAIQELKGERIQATKDSMTAGRHSEKPGDNRYIPGGGITISRG